MLRPPHSYEVEAYLDVRDMPGAGECAAWVGASNCPTWVPAPAVAGSVLDTSERWIPAWLHPTSEVTPRMSSGRSSVLFFSLCSVYEACTMEEYGTRRLSLYYYAGHDIYLSCTIYGLVLAISFAVGDGRSQFQWLRSKIRTLRMPHKSRQYPSLP